MMHSLWTLSVQLGARRDTHHVQITNRGEQAVKQAPPRTDAARLLRPLQAPTRVPLHNAAMLIAAWGTRCDRGARPPRRSSACPGCRRSRARGGRWTWCRCALRWPRRRSRWASACAWRRCAASCATRATLASRLCARRPPARRAPRRPVGLPDFARRSAGSRAACAAPRSWRSAAARRCSLARAAPRLPLPHPGLGSCRTCDVHTFSICTLYSYGRSEILACSAYHMPSACASGDGVAPAKNVATLAMLGVHL